MGSFDALLGTERRYAFTCAAAPPDTFALVDMEGEEGLSKLYRFTVTFMSENAGISLDEMLYAKATLTVYPKVAEAQPEPYHGMVVEFEQLQQAGPFTFYRAVLVPQAWRLTCFRLSEVYLNQTVPQVIEDVLKKAGLTGGDYRLELAGTYRAWPFICQYQETYLNFLGRLMERDGIYYFFEQGAEQETLIITDQQAFQPNSRKAVWYRPVGGVGDPLREDAIQSFVGKRNPLARKVVLQDYNYMKASLPLLAEAEVSPKGVGDLWVYGEHFETPDEGHRLATLRAEEIRCRGKLYYGEGTVAGIRPGYTIDLKGHYRSDFDAAYEVTEIRHEGSQRGLLLGDQPATSESDAARVFYRNEFTAIPADVQYRPPLVTPRPIIPGPVPAVVDAEGSGQYAELDEHGRYKVQVYFDQTEKAAGKGSHYIRSMTPSTGRDYGMHLLPHHKGAEVLVGFENGDPDRPVLLGAVPNSENLNTVTNTNQTQSVLQTRGNNLIAIEDKEGSERIYLKTPKGQTHIRMGAAKAESGSGTEPGRCQDGEDDINGLCFETENHSYTEVGQNSVEIIHGDSTETVGGNMTETIGGDVRETIHGTSFELVMGGYNGEVILGADTYIVVGPRVDTALGASVDFFLGAVKMELVPLAWSLELTGGISTEVHNFHVNATDNEIKALSKQVKAVGNRVDACENEIQVKDMEVGALQDRVNVCETEIYVKDQEIGAIETKIQTAEASIKTMATEILDCQSSIRNAFVAINDHETVMSNAGITILS